MSPGGLCLGGHWQQHWGYRCGYRIGYREAQRGEWEKACLFVRVKTFVLVGVTQPA